VAHLLGAMALVKETGRISVLPPFNDIGSGDSLRFLSFSDVFLVEHIQEFVPAITLESLINHPDINTIWPEHKRRLTCFYPDKAVCNRLSDRPHRRFWDHINI
jgi:hypothetical protein